MAALGALTLIGATGHGHAEDQQQVSFTAPSVAGNTATAPSFAPSEEAVFEEAFARYDIPADPVRPASAVDITTIEPAEPATRTLGSGIASYYGRRFHGRPTANGERFDMHELTAAHRTLPFGSRVNVTNPRTGRSVVVRINDRGPFVRGRVLDLSRAAAEEIGIIRSGHGNVELELLEG